MAEDNLHPRWGLGSVNHQFFWMQCFIQAAMIVLVVLFGAESKVLLVLALVGLILLGIPHGGNDFYYRPDKSFGGSIRFLVYYTGCMLLYLAIWWLFSWLALLIFLVISMHHFGQSNFENSRWNAPESLMWGGWLLVFPMVKHASEVVSIFSEMLGFSATNIDFKGPYSDVETLGFTICFGLIYAWVLVLRKTPYRWQYLFQWGMVSVWYWLTPLILGFVVVFCYWHALQSMRYQIVYIKQRDRASIGSIIRGFLPLGLLALLGMAVCTSFDVMNHLGLGFVLLSLVSLPHVVVMDGIYRK